MILTFIALSIVSTRPTAEAHGNLDQSLAGDPGCNASNFPIVVDVASTPRQEFVPSGELVSSVAVCIEPNDGGTIDIAVREGTAGSPGALVGAKSVSVPPSGAFFVHADFLSPLAVTSGDGYVIEVQSGGNMQWLGVADDQYPPGGSNSAAEDLGFRSYLAPAPPATSTSTRTTIPTSVTTTGPTKTPTKSPTKTATPPATATPVIVATATPVVVLPTAAPSTQTPSSGATARPATVTGTNANGSSTPKPAGTASGSPTATPSPRPSSTRIGAVLATDIDIRPPDVAAAAVSEGGGSSLGFTAMMAIVGALVAGGAAIYGVGRWRMTR